MGTPKKMFAPQVTNATGVGIVGYDAQSVVIGPSQVFACVNTRHKVTLCRLVGGCIARWRGHDCKGEMSEVQL
jgi:hypothetical protein